MTQILIFMLYILEVLTASTSPLLSKFGYSFRSGEGTVNIGSQSPIYDLTLPYTSVFSNNSIGLALSMVSYNQSFDSTFKIHYRLLENTPTPSNKTHAVFRVELGLYLLTSRARVRYLAYFTSILSPNFNILIN